MAARDVLRIVLAQARLVPALRRRIRVAGIAALRTILAEKIGLPLRPAWPWIERQFRFDQVGHFGRSGRAGIDEVIGHDKVGPDAPGDLFHLRALELVVEIAGRCDAGARERRDVRRKMFALQVAQHLVEHQMVNVINRVGGDKDGQFLVARVFIDLEELEPLGRRDDKTVLRQELFLGRADFELAGNCSPTPGSPAEHSPDRSWAARRRPGDRWQSLPRARWAAA